LNKKARKGRRKVSKMKKKCLIAVAIAAALAAMPLVSGAAVSPTGGSSSSSSSGSSSSGSYRSSRSSRSSSSSRAASVAGVASGTVVTVPSTPTVQVASNGARTSVASTTKDAKGTTIGLVTNKVTGSGVQVSSNSRGELVIGNVTVSIATDSAETAGLPEQVVDAIKSLNSNAALSDAISGLNLEGYSKVSGTRAVIANDQGGNTTTVEVSMTVDSLTSDAAVSVLCYVNMTGQWVLLPNVQVDPVTKVVTFNAPGSCTVQIIAK